MNSKRLTTAIAQRALSVCDTPFVELFSHGSLSVEFYQPESIDTQEPHSRDEIYVIASGSGIFFLEGKTQAFETGEVIFVPAGSEHRFQTFSKDFSTWVFFFGPEGGEKEHV